MSWLLPAAQQHSRSALAFCNMRAASDCLPRPPPAAHTYRGAFDVLNPHRPKYSPKVLNMRHREKNAARMCKFDEAHFMKLKCDAQVRREELAYRRQKEAKLDAELRKLEQSQSLEMASLLKRQKRDRSTLERGRDKAIDCIRTKYRNRSIKISSQYKIADAKAKNAENVSEKAAHPVQVPMTRRGSQLTL